MQGAAASSMHLLQRRPPTAIHQTLSVSLCPSVDRLPLTQALRNETAEHRHSGFIREVISVVRTLTAWTQKETDWKRERDVNINTPSVTLSRQLTFINSFPAIDQLSLQFPANGGFLRQSLFVQQVALLHIFCKENRSLHRIYIL